MLWVKSARRLRRPASLIEGFEGWGEDWGWVEMEGGGLGLRFLSSPFAGWEVEELEDVDVDVAGWSLASEWE